MNENTNANPESILASDYILTKRCADGISISFELDGDELMSTTCAECGDTMFFEFEDFCQYVAESGLYGVSWHCSNCTAKRRAAEGTAE